MIFGWFNLGCGVQWHHNEYFTGCNQNASASTGLKLEALETRWLAIDFWGWGIGLKLTVIYSVTGVG
jgi:hypothetical protein